MKGRKNWHYMKERQLKEIEDFMGAERAKLTKPDGSKIALPQKAIDTALLMASGSNLPELEKWNILTVDVVKERTIGVISEMQGDLVREYSCQFEKYLSDAIFSNKKKYFDEILTDYIVCWKLGDLGNKSQDGGYIQSRVQLTSNTHGWVQVAIEGGLWKLHQTVMGDTKKVDVIVLHDLLSKYVD